jgi:chromosome partitioning protein
MAYVNCICNQKGGAGKTSVTYNVGCVLAQEFNKKVLFIDVDGQANLTTSFGLNPDEIKNNIAELLTIKKPNVKEFILETKIKNAYLIPSNQYTFSAEKKLYNTNAREFILSDIIDKIKKDYDFIFIDTPPNLAIITLNALIASNNIILVYTASEFSLDGISQILGTLDEITENNRLNINDTKIIGAIQNRFKSSTKIVNKKVTEELEGITDIPLYFTSISDTTEIEKSQFAHLPIITFNSKHKISTEYRSFAKEFLDIFKNKK